MTRLVLLDRDGVINRDSDDYVKSLDEFCLIPGSVAAIARLHQAGLKVGVCTNQSGIARGYLSEATLAAIHDHLHAAVRAAAGRIDAISYCPHLPDAGCRCRKPAPGMLLELMQRLKVSPTETLFVGDSVRDLEAALAAGCEPVLVRTGNGRNAEQAASALGLARIYDSLADFADGFLDLAGVQH